MNLSECFAQHTLSGQITENYGPNNPIPFVSILIKSPEDNLLKFTYSDLNGFYSTKLPEGSTNFLIETSIISHLSEKRELRLDTLQDQSTLDFKLSLRLNELEEVFIQGKNEPIKIESDTTTYNINNFKDGNERVVEDILKKLPGITVASNGAIKFKGKSVIRLLLDGDNIFDSNYSIGTKNIDSEIIESVQAIEDYNDNPLLKGVKTSEDVAINLVLKNGISDFSGNAEVGIGIKDKVNLKTNSVVVSKALKGFFTFNHNNIGENSSPYYLGSNTIELSKLNEAENRAENFFALGTDNFLLPLNRINENKNSFGSANTLFSINKKMSIRINYSLFSDKLTNTNSSQILYLLNNDSINVNTQENNAIKPFINAWEYEFIYSVNNKSRLTSLGKLEIEKTTKETQGFNNENIFESNINNNDLFITHLLEYTYRINNNNVFIFSGNVSSNNIPQELSVQSENNSFDQEINSTKNSFGIKSSFLYKNNNKEFVALGGIKNTENYLDTKLESGFNNQFFYNDLYYSLNNSFFNLKYNFKKDPWNISLRMDNDLFDVKIKDINENTRLEKNVILINPSISFNYKTNQVSSVLIQYNLSNRPFNIHNIFSNPILISNREIINNEFNFNFFNTHFSEVGYKINDFYNLFQLNIYTRHSFDRNDIISRYDINENFNLQTSFLSVTNNNNLEFGLNLEKYVHPLRNTINFNSSYSIQEYQNIVNEIEVRENLNKTFFGELKFRTGFKGKLNFENNFSLRQNRFENEFNSNSLTSIKNQFDINWISDKFHFNLSNNYFHSDIVSNLKSNFLLDGSIGFQSKSKKIEYILKARNILNQKNYSIVANSDFYTSVFTQSLVERFLLFSIRFKY